MTSSLTSHRAHSRSALRALLAAAGTVLIIGTWLAFAPAALGGSSVYVTTFGTSMEPALHRGDLAIVRPQASYRVGDVVAYRSVALHTVVLHRIVQRDGDRFLVKGDNNSWTDTDHPTVDQVIGRMEVHVPHLGGRVRQVASPPAIAALVGAAALPVGFGTRRRRGGRRTAARSVAPASSRPSRRGIDWTAIDQRLLTATAVAAALIAIGFLKAPTIHTVAETPVDDESTFAYSGTARGADAVYSDGRVRSGDPVFTNLVDTINVDFTYAATAAGQALATTGSLTLDGQLRDASGWAHPFALAPTVRLASTGGHATGVLDLAELRRVIDAKESATGVHRDAYSVVVRAALDRTVLRGASASTAAFDVKLSFDLDNHELRLVNPGPETLHPSHGDLLTTPVVRTNQIVLLGHGIPIRLLRAIAAALALLVGAVWIDALRRASSTDEVTSIDARYRTLLVPVRSLGSPRDDEVEVASIAALSQLATQAGAPILHADGTYQVAIGPSLYRYTVESGDAA